MADNKCEWSLEFDDPDCWYSGCGKSWVFFEGGPIDNELNFCPFCGKKVSERNELNEES